MNIDFNPGFNCAFENQAYKVLKLKPKKKVKLEAQGEKRREVPLKSAKIINCYQKLLISRLK